MQNEFRNIIEPWIYILHKNGNENMIYRKLVTILYNGLHKSMFYYWENLFLCYFQLISKEKQ